MTADAPSSIAVMAWLGLACAVVGLAILLGAVRRGGIDRGWAAYFVVTGLAIVVGAAGSLLRGRPEKFLVAGLWVLVLVQVWLLWRHIRRKKGTTIG